ncbi:MAG: glycine cleavage system aminomethyltransferase GcvT, partial [Sphingomonadales bacterium]|nr:glycine cleavage system aminomethyltransferase GcvT [Sphingomonadales bacterium]
MSETNDRDDEDAAPLLSLPLDGWHRARGARMVAFAGYHMPVQYDGIIAEHLWTRAHAGLFDVSHMGQLGVSGAGAAAALETLLPGDIAGLRPGQMRYSLLLDAEGGILDDLIVTNRGDGFGLVVNGATKWDDIAHLREHLPDAITLNHLDEHGLLALQGPEAARVLARLGLEPALPGTSEAGALGFMQAGAYRWQGRVLGVSRSGYTGEDGFEISVRAEDMTALADALAAAPEVKPVGLGARDSLRLEAGLPLYGHDLSPETDPVSAGLGFAISKRRRTEGGFPGAGP